MTDQSGADRAARFALDWNGSCEGDEMLECCAFSPEDGEDGGQHVVHGCAGRKAGGDDGDLIAKFETFGEADAFAAAYNAAALAKMAEADWTTLPRPVDHFYFGRCDFGKYPKSRLARIAVSVGGKEITVTGYGNSKFIGDRFSYDAMVAAINKLVEALRQPLAG